MDPIKDLYKNWVSEELNSPEMQTARDSFLRENFQASAPAGFSFGFFLSPAFRLAFIGCFALAIMVKTGVFEDAQPVAPAQVTTAKKISIALKVAKKQTPLKQVTKKSPPRTNTPVKSSLVPVNRIQVKKLNSQMGNTAIYQKHFADVQITVLWVFPKGA